MARSTARSIVVSDHAKTRAKLYYRYPGRIIGNIIGGYLTARKKGIAPRWMPDGSYQFKIPLPGYGTAVVKHNPANSTAVVVTILPPTWARQRRDAA